MDELISQVLLEMNAVSRTEDAALVAYAEEMAAGVSAEREAEITADLPVPYTLEESATADLSGDTLRVPRMAVVTATKVGAGGGKRPGVRSASACCTNQPPSPL